MTPSENSMQQAASSEDDVAQGLRNTGVWYPVPEQPTLRDQFAMAALQGMFAEDAEGYTFNSAAKAAYAMADAMLAERAKK